MAGRVEICGGIASGKTTLAEVLAQHDLPSILEDFQSNPFWELFYEDPAQYAFETEVTFLLQHFNQIKLGAERAGLFACDFSLLLDLAYADVNLSGSQYDTFHVVYREVTRALPPPMLIVHLLCGADDELARIRARKRNEEGGIEISYLAAVNAAVERRVEEASTKTSVLRIDSEANDFAHDIETRERVAQEVLAAVQQRA